MLPELIETLLLQFSAPIMAIVPQEMKLGMDAAVAAVIMQVTILPTAKSVVTLT